MAVRNPADRPSVADVQFLRTVAVLPKTIHPFYQRIQTNMPNRLRLLPAITLFVFLLPVGASAQSLVPGKWTGYIIPPSGAKMDVFYDVRVESDTLRIDIVNEEVGRFPFTDVAVTDDGLKFGWAPGVQLFCELFLKANGGYEGECAPEDGESGTLVMNRPATKERP
jgi:hypothetical protein